MTSKSILRLEHLENGMPLLYHQHAITHVAIRRDKKLPSQLVYPDGNMSIGFPPTSLRGLFSTVRAGTTESEEERQQRLQQGTVVVYASETERAVIQPILERLAFYWFLCLAIQAIGIIVALAGGSLVPFNPPTGAAASPGQLSWAVQTLYSFMLGVHLLPLVGYFWRFADFLAVYNALNVVLFLLGFALTLNSLLAVIILLSTAGLRVIGSHVKFFAMPHCFTVKR
ncbi:unnamed protein product [Vitrella brassicaformis CCMP3155]|uniref:Uncharacterized protein n=1 Tax=Vitrella brassicaformis (strain CCMP3155) TaxID=1169540 RepID=A0A0G4FY13_VITBC|nr:unnamed protein product [Vitrella brassicaformis CCMP3155]|mmetsp:Transcript_21480/g.52568  ORF Transcript_21480/g.52568 Transcript_21480/m.52568 type:complete len:227 (-) Transcript_21480:1680-2360(-)|eukprot:CEM20316.1 unnamed protein product [Vitrella brassicaformis CCMP3155]